MNPCSAPPRSLWGGPGTCGRPVLKGDVPASLSRGASTGVSPWWASMAKERNDFWGDGTPWFWAQEVPVTSPRKVCWTGAPPHQALSSASDLEVPPRKHSVTGRLGRQQFNGEEAGNDTK